MTRVKRLGVNIDHVATLRNARGGIHPDISTAAKLAEDAGADLITIHVREDRRHVNEDDLNSIMKVVNIPINLEIAVNREMIAIANKYKPHSVCFVPENREEVTTEGGLNVVEHFDKIKKSTEELSINNIEVSLFIDPDKEQLFASKDLGIKIIELHTGAYAGAFFREKDKELELKKIINIVELANNLEIRCHAGHGLNFNNVSLISAIPGIIELNIGHFLIGDAVFNGLQNSIIKMKKIIRESVI